MVTGRIIGIHDSLPKSKRWSVDLGLLGPVFLILPGPRMCPTVLFLFPFCFFFCLFVRGLGCCCCFDFDGFLLFVLLCFLQDRVSLCGSL